MGAVAGGLILIVEDEARIAEVLERFLRAEGFRTERAADGRRALELWRAARPDLVLLDLMIPPPDGLEVLRTIRREAQTPVIVLTARVEEIDRLLGLELGADDYVTKPFSAREVVARVKAVLRRVNGRLRAPQRYRVGELELDLEAFQVRCRGQALSLTATQFRLLHAFMAHPGKAFSRGELLDLFGEEAPDERTIDAHIKNLRARLGDCGSLLQTVRGVGYRLAGEQA
ncbi:response regulator transcription factor [Calidithermus timidus]|jgi:DNA-binding response OmpR family regulator|uniref:response regulator transcription factor n=1 Tax=Calidithermus timidus TaxID=307124 RepID=UPI0003A0D931|nr:response regulator transcription factor [Calidithermus timidus]